MTDTSAFYEIALVLALACALGFLGQKLRQPLIIMFLLAGILAGPSFLGIIRSYDQVKLFAQVGIALLLFIVGLRLDLNLIRTIGPVALATGLGQIIFTSVIGFFIALAMAMSPLSAAYVSVALTFSSTIIIVKLLSDKREIDSLHGRIAVGFLIVQDIAAIVALVGLTTFGSGFARNGQALGISLLMLAKGIGFLAAIGLLMKYVLPRLLRRLAYSQELLTLSAIAWAILLGATGEKLGFSKEVGAFLAGVSLASSEYRDSIAGRLVSLRDFLLLFFFIDLGALLDWSTVGSQFGGSIVFSVFVLIGNPLIVIIIMGLMGYRRRTSFLAGLTVAQISEFSLIVGALGVSLGHIMPETMGLITLVGVATIFASTYMILYSGALYRLCADFLKPFERRIPFREPTGDIVQDIPSADVILVGLGNYGSGLAEYLLQRRKRIIGVDFDPRALETWSSRGVSVLYGDMADPELHEQLPLEKAPWVVSTVRNRDLNIALLSLLKQRGYGGKVALTAADPREAKIYRNLGAHVVFRPFTDAAEQAADALSHAMDMLPEETGWPIAFREIRLRSGSAFAGKTVKDIPLRSETGVSIIAVSRAGRSYYDPGPDFQLYPGDRLVTVGPPSELKKAESFLTQMEEPEAGDRLKRFELAEISIAENSDKAGRTLAELQFRQKYGVTVVGIRRGNDHIAFRGPHERLLGGDVLVVIGESEAVDAIKRMEPL
jgi:Kef-type K+ transport system membrane component KefB/Trk K+ transport system NAD-binding subunit